MGVIFTKSAQEDLQYWKKTNPKLAQRVQKLIEDIQEHLFIGIGKPEPLRFEKSDYWSRRINQEHRLIYKVTSKNIYVAQCRYHY